jgi:Predicted lipoprotein of unknown function (DUF2380)
LGGFISNVVVGGIGVGVGHYVGPLLGKAYEGVKKWWTGRAAQKALTTVNEEALREYGERKAAEELTDNLVEYASKNRVPLGQVEGGGTRPLPLAEAGKVASTANQAAPQIGNAVASQTAQLPRITGQINIKPLALPSPEFMQLHHVFPQTLRDWFVKRGLENIDDYTIWISRTTHLKGLHGKGLGYLKGRWNQHWQQFKTTYPNATPNQIFKFGEDMMKQYGLEHLRFIKYR